MRIYLSLATTLNINQFGAFYYIVVYRQWWKMIEARVLFFYRLLQKHVCICMSFMSLATRLSSEQLTIKRFNFGLISMQNIFYEQTHYKDSYRNRWENG